MKNKQVKMEKNRNLPSGKIRGNPYGLSMVVFLVFVLVGHFRSQQDQWILYGFPLFLSIIVWLQYRYIGYMQIKGDILIIKRLFKKTESVDIHDIYSVDVVPGRLIDFAAFVYEIKANEVSIFLNGNQYGFKVIKLFKQLKLENSKIKLWENTDKFRWK